MPDVYAAIAEVEVATQERLAAILELRAADPQQRAMLDSYLSGVRFSPVSRVLEVGCGPGAVTRVLARWPEVAEAVGVDPSPVFVAKAGELASELGNASFEEGDGRALRFGDGDFDVVVCHTVLCHVPEPERLRRPERGATDAAGPTQARWPLPPQSSSARRRPPPAGVVS